MANKWDDFHENMGDESAALHMSGAFDSTVGHDHDSTLPGRGAQISYNSLKDKPTSIANATNVTTNINGMAVTDIFESDKKTVKKATHATSADSATLAEAAKGDIRFQISGSYNLNTSINALTSLLVQKHLIVLKTTEVLKIKGIRFQLDTIDLRLKISADQVWLSSGLGGEYLDLDIPIWLGTSEYWGGLQISIYNSNPSSPVTTANYMTWWLDLAIEDV